MSDEEKAKTHQRVRLETPGIGVLVARGWIPKREDGFWEGGIPDGEPPGVILHDGRCFQFYGEKQTESTEEVRVLCYQETGCVELLDVDAVNEREVDAPG